MNLPGNVLVLAGALAPAVVSCVLVLLHRRVAGQAWRALAATAGPPRPLTDPLDPYELGWIQREGKSLDRVRAVALVRMELEGRLVLKDRRGYDRFRTRVAKRPPRDEVEAALVAEVRRGTGFLSVHASWDGKPPAGLWEAFDRRSVLDGLRTERGMPAGVLADSPAAAAWRSGRRRARRALVAGLTVVTVAGVAAAVWCGVWQLTAPQAVLLAALVVRHRLRPERPWGRTALARAHLAAAEASPPDDDPVTGVLRRVALSGLRGGLPEGHPLTRAVVPPPPAPPFEPAPQTFDFDFNSPGLGGL